MTALPPPDVPAHPRPRPLERLEAEIVELATQVTAATARLIALVGAFDAAEGWREWGMRSTAHWLSWQCGIGLGAGREQVRVARALRELPLAAEAFAAGRLSYSKIRALTRLATPQTEADLVDLAQSATAAQVERLLAAKRRSSRADDADQGAVREYLRVRVDTDGSLVGSFRFCPDRGAAVMHALDTARGRVVDPGQEGDDVSAETSAATPRPRRSLPDALHTIAQRYLADVSAETSSEAAEIYQLVIHATPDALGGDGDNDSSDHGTLELQAPGGHPVGLSRRTAQRLTCDCPTTVMVAGADGSTVHVGRRTRRIRGRLRRAVFARDRGLCRAPGCAERATEIHHLRHWANGGPTCLPNLVSVCDLHHWLVHDGGWTLATRRPGQWALIGPNGVTVGPTPPPAPDTEPLPYDDTLAPDAVTGHWCGDRLDASLVLEGLQAAERAGTAGGAVADPAGDTDAIGDIGDIGDDDVSAETSAGGWSSVPQFQFTPEQIDRFGAYVDRLQRQADWDNAIWVDE